MKRFRKCFHCTKRSLLQIHLVDKCLIIFMSVLLIQSAFSLFHPASLSNEMGDIDIIVRTSSASIFGYFLSANFIKRFSKKEQTKRSRNKEGILMDVVNEEPSLDIPEDETCANRLQVIVATVIGLFCLIALLIQRNFLDVEHLMINSTSTTVTIAQFRDFISGCVGFLIGTPTHRSS